MPERQRSKRQRSSRRPNLRPLARSRNYRNERNAKPASDRLSPFKVLKTTNELFTQSVKNVLPRMHFSPAMIGGKPVNQLVQQSFQFAVPR